MASFWWLADGAALGALLEAPENLACLESNANGQRLPTELTAKAWCFKSPQHAAQDFRSTCILRYPPVRSTALQNTDVAAYRTGLKAESCHGPTPRRRLAGSSLPSIPPPRSVRTRLFEMPFCDPHAAAHEELQPPYLADLPTRHAGSKADGHWPADRIWRPAEQRAAAATSLTPISSGEVMMRGLHCAPTA